MRPEMECYRYVYRLVGTPCPYVKASGLRTLDAETLDAQTLAGPTLPLFTES